MHSRPRRVLLGSICVAALIGACDDMTGPGSPGIHVTNATLNDTVLSTHPLALIVGDRSGRPAGGVAVRFETPSVIDPNDPNSFPFRVFVAARDSTNFRIALVDTTDAAGAVSVKTQFGQTAGPGDLIVTVPDLGFIDTVRFTIEAGHAADVTVVPADTAVYATHGFTLRATAIDQYRNPRPDVPVALSVAYGPVSVDLTGAVVATAIGRAAIIAQSAGHSDTAYVSVVPPGWVASQKFYPGNGGPEGIFLMQLDGSGRDSLAPGLDNSFIPHGFAWSPDGRQLALVRGDVVNLLEPGGAERPLVQMSDALNTAARFSRDGQWVYFALAYGTAAQAQGLYRIKIDGTGLEHIGRDGSDYFVSPSHDGQSVAYVSARTPCFNVPCIRVLDLATNQDRTYGTQDFLVQGAMAAWSPVEGLIAYSNGSSLNLVRSDGTGTRSLASDVGQVKWMDWSPDGRWLVVAADPGVMLFEVQTGLRLPLGQFSSYGATAWRP